MENKQYIAVIGHCPKTNKELSNSLQSIVEAHPEAEINFFDMPCQGSKNSGDWIDSFFVHRYAISITESEMVRDIIALGPCKVIILDKMDKTIQNIANMVRSYGVEIIEPNR